MKKRLVIALLGAFIISLFIISSCHAQYKKPQKPTGPAADVKVDSEKYPPSGVVIGEALITAGERLPILWGIMGPPDKIWAMRSKDDVNKDYVKLDYYSYGLSFDVNSNTNQIQGILIEENNRIFKLKEVPFRIGQSHKDIIESWGEPENSEPGILAFWRRGVYIGVDDSGAVSYIFLTNPGVFEDEAKKNENKDSK